MSSMVWLPELRMVILPLRPNISAETSCTPYRSERLSERQNFRESPSTLTSTSWLMA